MFDNQAPEEVKTKSIPDNDESPKQAEIGKENVTSRAKYPHAIRPGVSSFLTKRLQKGLKYFDSGDYNMAKAKGKDQLIKLPNVPQHLIGNAVLTPTSPTHLTPL